MTTYQIQLTELYKNKRLLLGFITESKNESLTIQTKTYAAPSNSCDSREKHSAFGKGQIVKYNSQNLYCHTISSIPKNFAHIHQLQIPKTLNTGTQTDDHRQQCQLKKVADLSTQTEVDVSRNRFGQSSFKNSDLATKTEKIKMTLEKWKGFPKLTTFQTKSQTLKI